jgi:serpin B
VLADLIGAPASVDEQNRQYARLLKVVYGDRKRPFELVMANALWGQHDYHFKPAFQEAIADYYDGALHVVDFRTQPEKAVQTINTWVSDKTKARIKDLIPLGLIGGTTRLILTNAIYFKGQWQTKFLKAATKVEDWHGLTGTARVPMMHQRGSYLYSEGGGFQALDLPYQGRQLSMLVVLPRKNVGLVSMLLGRGKDSLTALERKWAAADLYRQVTASLRMEDVIVSLPRFRMESAFELKPVLCALGIGLAFSDDDADFSGMGDEPLKISEVVHKAFVEVNEEGTEAAAATGVVMMFKGRPAPRPKPKVFRADHPFLFFIRDQNTNAVLFCGRVLDPG